MKHRLELFPFQIVRLPHYEQGRGVTIETARAARVEQIEAEKVGEVFASSHLDAVRETTVNILYNYLYNLRKESNS